MEQTQNGKTTQQPGTENITSTEQGRQPGSPQQASAEKTDDISQVDQQEGQMNNGELGGNFNTAGEEKQ